MLFFLFTFLCSKPIAFGFLTAPLSYHKETLPEYGEPSNCTTPLNENGTCIHLAICQDLYVLVNISMQDTSIRNLLKKSFCGGNWINPKVCCPVYSINNKTFWKQNISYENLPTPSQCAVSNTTRTFANTSHIENFDDWPWLASLGYIDAFNSNLVWRCRGALIAKRHVLTAAHCTILSASILQLTTIRLSSLYFGIENTVIHPKFNRYRAVNDIALIRLDSEVDFTKYKPLCLPSGAELRSEIYVSSFPFIVQGNSKSHENMTLDTVHRTYIPVVSNKICQMVYRRKHMKIYSQHLCAGDLEKDSCKGDSGGPLVWTSHNVYYAIGLVSFGPRCHTSRHNYFPGVYTRVTDFIDWINGNMILK